MADNPLPTDDPADLVAAIAAIADLEDRAEQAWLVGGRLVEKGLLSEAETIGKHMEAWPLECSWLFSRIAAQRWALGERERAEKLLSEAVGRATGHGAKWQRAEALVKAAQQVSEVDWEEPCRALLSDAVSLAGDGQSADNLQDSLDSGSVLREAAVLSAQLGYSDLAQHALALVANEVQRKRTVEQITEATQRRKAG
jgi:hypothetical protein